MALTPFLAVGLFFLFGFQGSFAWSWLWFLIIPIAAIIIYVPAPTVPWDRHRGPHIASARRPGR